MMLPSALQATGSEVSKASGLYLSRFAAVVMVMTYVGVCVTPYCRFATAAADFLIPGSLTLELLS